MLNSCPLRWERKSFCTFVLLGGCCRAVFEQKKPAQSPLAEHGHTGKLSFQETNTKTSKLDGERTELASGKHKNHHEDSFETRPALAEAGMLPCPPPYGSTAPFLPTRKRCSTLLRSAQLTALRSKPLGARAVDSFQESIRAEIQPCLFSPLAA